MKLKSFFLYICLLCTMLPAAAEITGQWQLHPTFHNSVTRIIDTPSGAYFMGYNQSRKEEVTFLAGAEQSLFFYDKDGGESYACAQRHDLSGTAVDFIEYNPHGEYLVIVYTDSDIDFLYDDGRVVNIPALKQTSIPASKKVNGISFDKTHHLAILATGFGYVAIDDSSCQIKESAIFNSPLTAAIRVGDTMVLAEGNTLYYAPVSAQRFTLQDYKAISSFPPISHLLPLSDSKFVVCTGDGKNVYDYHDIVDGTPVSDHADTFAMLHDVHYTKTGFALNSWKFLWAIDAPYGSTRMVARPSEFNSDYTFASADLKTAVRVQPLHGVSTYKINADQSWSITSQPARPNAPASYLSRAMLYTPQHGLLTGTFGNDGVLTNNAFYMPNLLSSYKGGLWDTPNPVYRAEDYKNVGRNPYGITQDPDNPDYVYLGSQFSGLVRMNLKNPSDQLIISHPADEAAGLKGFVSFFPSMPAWLEVCQTSAPLFDNDGRLWTAFRNLESGRTEYYYWNPADRKASVSTQTFRPLKKMASKTQGAGVFVFQPLTSQANKNLLLYISNTEIEIIDHNGTPDNTADDKSVLFSSVTDQDGGAINLYGISSIFEDQESGTVWLGTRSGVYYCSPRAMLQGQRVLSRVKVSRNDGTNIADYLLSGVGISHITTDPLGRKWFATLGAGIVVTSGDGKIVIGEFTEANSPLPSDQVLQLCYNPEHNSMMVSTMLGMAEFHLGGNNGTEGKSSVRAFPNPVAPDYYGWVTIDGLPFQTLVKIVDSEGNLVRELGVTPTGSIQWDLLNLHNRRVATGVYYVLSSSANQDTKSSNVAKILVLN